IHPLVRANYLASPPLVVAYAIAGSMTLDITRDPIGKGKDGKDVFLRDIWPTNHEVQEVVGKTVTQSMFRAKYADVFSGDDIWQGIQTAEGQTYSWVDDS